MTRNLLPGLLDRPLRQFPSLWSNFSIENFLDEDLFRQDFSIRGTRVYEEGNQLHVEIPLPGLNLKDIEVSLNKGTLFVKGESAEEERNKKRKYYRSSKRNYSFSLFLPTEIEEKQEPQAIYTEGILKVSLQLAKQSETKKITVKSGDEKK